MHIDNLDLNLLRIFIAVHRSRSVSKAARMLDIGQPVASQGLARLRLALGDPLFVRAGGGVAPTPLSDRLLPAVESAMNTLERALAEQQVFDPARSTRLLRLHMSDLGECRVLPPLMARLRGLAPGLRIESSYVPLDRLSTALDCGDIDLAFGVLPSLSGMRSQLLSQDRYQIFVRRTHPLAMRPARSATIEQLHFVAARTHADTVRILRLLGLNDRLALTVEHFTALPSIVRASDLAAVSPRAIASLFPDHEFTVLNANFPMDEYSVSMYWSHRFENDPANRWLRDLVVDCLAKR